MKNKVNYKILNALIILVTIFMLYLMADLWTGLVSKILNIILPFIIAFGVAYILYPFLNFLVNKKIPKPLAILIIVTIIVLVFGLTAYYVVPLFIDQLVNLLSNLGKVSKDLATKYNIDMTEVNNIINNFSGKILSSIGTYISDGSLFGVISQSIGYLTKFIVISIVSIYFLSDMDKIRIKVRSYLKKKNVKKYEVVKNLDREVYSYLKGLGIFMIIQFFEYTLLFFVVGHPNFLLLGVLACITTVIPYFGGIITNVIALIISSVVSTKLFILTLIITFIFPNIDGYVISPKIYGKTNQMPPLLTIFAVTAGGALFGFKGIIIAVPLTIMIMSVYRTYKGEIGMKISNFKEKM